ncbi:uncharacterized protein [Onthophagus taurus]|uniref:uncharacterized protein n=1 Tax=Onthophagus taurus TaxID=166361 RepID=UPI0039BE25BF
MTEHTKLSKAIIKRTLPYERLIETADIGKNIKDQAQHDIFMVRANEIDSVYASFQSFHNQIIGLIEDDQYDAQDQIRKDADMAYFSIKALIRKHESSNDSPALQPASPKLTKLTIPIFDGNFKNWPTFYDLFRTIVHENDPLSNVAKYQYLLTSLKDESFNLLKGFPVTNDNYTGCLSETGH